MLNQVNIPNAGSVLCKAFDFALFSRFKDNGLIGASKRSDGTTDAEGTLYPINLNAQTTQTGGIQAYATAEMLTNIAGYFTADTYLYTTLQTKMKVAENYFTRYKRFIAAKLSTITKSNIEEQAIQDTAQIKVHKVIELTASLVVLMYTRVTNTNTYLVAATIAADGTMTYGTPVLLGNAVSALESEVGMCAAGTAKGVAIYKSTTGSRAGAKAFTVAGTTITLGAELLLGANGTDFVDVCPLAATDKVMFYFRDTTTTFATFTAATIAGTTFTVGATVNTGTVLNHGIVTQNGTDKVFFVGNNNANSQPWAVSMTVAGTVTTLGTGVSIGSGTQEIKRDTNGRQAVVARLAVDKFLVMAQGSSGTCYNSIATIAVNVVTAQFRGSFSMPWGNSNMNTLWEVTAGTEYYISSNGNMARVYVSPNTPYNVSLGNVPAATTIQPILFDGTMPAALLQNQSYVYLLKMSDGKGLYFSNGAYNSAIGQYTLRYAVTHPTSIGLFNDAVQMGTNKTLALPAIPEVETQSTTLGGKKFYFGIKNNDAVSKYIIINEVLAEVE